MVNPLTAPIPLPRVRPSRLWAVRLLLVCGLGFLVPLALWICAGAFSRMEADDFALAASARHLGLWGAQVYWYDHWHGRFSFQFLLDALALALPGHVWFLPPFFLLAWAGGVFFALRGGAALVGLALPRLWAASLAAAAVWTALWLTPEPQQATFWESGLLTYLAPLAGLALWTAFALHVLCRVQEGRPMRPAVILAGGAAFVLCGFSETATVVFLLWAGAASLLVLLLGRGTLRLPALILLLASLAGGGAAAAIMVHAPGNLIREAYCTPAPSFTYWAHKTWRLASLFIQFRLLANQTELAALAGLTALLALVLPAPPCRLVLLRFVPLLLLAVPALCFLSVLLCFGLTVYASSSGLPPRAELLPCTLLAGAVISMSAAPCLLARVWMQDAPYSVRAGLAGLAGAAAVFSLTSCLPEWTEAGQAEVVTMAFHARQWDAQDAFLRSSSGQAVLMRDLASPYAPSPVGGDCGSWPNLAVASYYGLPLVVEGGKVNRWLLPAERSILRARCRTQPGLSPVVNGPPLRLDWLKMRLAGR